jgi:hypothetical protein
VQRPFSFGPILPLPSLWSFQDTMVTVHFVSPYKYEGLAKTRKCVAALPLG